MVLGFKRQFEKKIVSGEKRHTIRSKSNRKWKSGMICDCFVDPRQKTMRLLGRWQCVKVDDIRITPKHEVFINGERLGFDECVCLAVSDGFDSFAGMMQFWRGRLPFEGDMIHWNFDHPVIRKTAPVQSPKTPQASISSPQGETK